MEGSQNIDLVLRVSKKILFCVYMLESSLKKNYENFFKDFYVLIGQLDERSLYLIIKNERSSL